jgi:hypothetical protein
VCIKLYIACNRNRAHNGTDESIRSIVILLKILPQLLIDNEKCNPDPAITYNYTRCTVVQGPFYVFLKMADHIVHSFNIIDNNTFCNVILTNESNLIRYRQFQNHISHDTVGVRFDWGG